MSKSEKSKKEAPVVEETPLPTPEQKQAESKKAFHDELAQEAADKRAKHRADRKAKLRELLAKACQRYQMVHGVSLTTGDLRDYAKWCREEERRRFLESKFVMLAETDQDLFEEILTDAGK